MKLSDFIQQESASPTLTAQELIDWHDKHAMIYAALNGETNKQALEREDEQVLFHARAVALIRKMNRMIRDAKGR
jgi:hypothetical protein